VLLALPGTAFARCEDFVARPEAAEHHARVRGRDAGRDRGARHAEFAVYEDYPPYSWDDGATPRGVDIEIGRLIAESLQVEPRFRFVSYGETARPTS
jgi:polar amino acid transport system substrate-binding protein